MWKWVDDKDVITLRSMETISIKLWNHLISWSEGYNIVIGMGHTPPQKVIIKSIISNNRLLLILINHGIDLDFVYRNSTPLIAAVKRCNIEGVRLLLSYGVDVRKQVDMKYSYYHTITPLDSALMIRNIDIINLLLDAGADPNTVIDNKILIRDPQIFDILASKGLKIGPDVVFEFPHLVKHLVENYDVDVNYKRDGKDFITHFISSSQMSMVELSTLTRYFSSFTECGLVTTQRSIDISTDASKIPRWPFYTEDSEMSMIIFGMKYALDFRQK